MERWVSVCCRVANSPSFVKRCRSRLALARLASSCAFLALAWSSAAWNGRGIDLREQVALFHQFAFLEGDLVDLAVDPGAHHDGVKTLHGAEPGQQHRKVSFLDRGDGDGNGGIARRGRRLLRAVGLRRVVGVESLPAESPQHKQGREQNPAHCQRLGHVQLRGFKNK